MAEAFTSAEVVKAVQACTVTYAKQHAAHVG